MRFRHIPIAALLLLTACQRTSSDSLLIGLSLNSMKDPFLLSLKESADETAKSLGARLVVTSSEANLAKQMNAVEDLIQRGVQVLGVNPVDAKGIVPAVRTANAAGIPVLTVDTDAQGGDVASFIGSDNVRGGELAARYIAERLGGAGRIAVLDDVPGKAAIMNRITGFHSVVDTISGLEIVTTQPAYGRRDNAITVMENILQAHPDIDAVFATADAMALGALGVLEAARRDKRIILVGFDACDEALTEIRAGRLDADIAQFPRRIGRTFVETAVRIARGEQVPDHIPIPVVLVTKENVDTFAAP